MAIAVLVDLAVVAVIGRPRNKLVQETDQDLAGDPEQEGIRICAELMQEIAEIPGVSGINLMTTGDPDAIPAAIEASGLRDRG